MIKITGTEIERLEAEAQAKFTVLDEYKTYLCCLDKPELVQVAKDAGIRGYTVRTRSNSIIGHLMTARRRDLGYEELLDAIDALKQGEV